VAGQYAGRDHASGNHTRIAPALRLAHAWYGIAVNETGLSAAGAGS
jgi:hypothetical protein